ncbi:MAG: hypothetical protein HFJ75_03080, partial [Eggerthellaceae bacterium]|nr:hypothetical protein [Eggerthellaceae bacterium]
MYRKEERELVLADFPASGLTARRFATLPGSPCAESIGRWLRQEEAGLL